MGAGDGRRMRNGWVRGAIAAVVLGVAASGLAQGVQPVTEASRQRVELLLKEMSSREKIGQLSQLFYFGPEVRIPGIAPERPIEEQVASGDVGSLLFVTDPAVINRLQRVAVEKSPHHIPLLFGYDVIHGFRTIFPVPLGLAASWDPELATRSQADAAAEARAVGIDWAFAPMVDIARDPRWGRIVEGAGEDPYLGSRMAAAQVRGFQGNGEAGHILACVKHFAGYGAAVGGRDYEQSDISDAQLENVYLPPFQAAVDAGVGSVMSAYMDLNDVPATGNRWLLEDVLRKRWGFQGFVVSDANAVKSLQVHGFAENEEDAAVRALAAGINLEMGLGHDAFQAHLAKALESGKVTMEQIDAAVRPILLAKVRLGLFEHPYSDEGEVKKVLGNPEHRRDAERAAERSAVLLRNEGKLLPLKPEAYRKVAVIGALADSKVDTLGSWTFQQDLPETVTVLEGLRAKLKGATVSYAPGVQLVRKFPSMFDQLTGVAPVKPWSAEEVAAEREKAVALARESDLAVLVLGEAANMSGESGSRESLDLPGAQEQLLEAVAATGKPVVIVLLNGRPLNLTWANEHVPAILEMWYPGTRGGEAVASLLTGEAVPGGKLPVTWPKNVGQVPQFYAHNTTHQPESADRRYWDEASTPLYPFGYGLSYAAFAYRNLRVEQGAGDAVTVTVDVANTGSVRGDEVVQLYTHQRYGQASRPVRELKGFERVTLAAGEAKAVRFTLDRKALAYWSAATRSWVNDRAAFDVWVGGDSQASLHGEFAMK